MNNTNYNNDYINPDDYNYTPLIGEIQDPLFEMSSIPTMDTIDSTLETVNEVAKEVFKPTTFNPQAELYNDYTYNNFYTPYYPIYSDELNINLNQSYYPQNYYDYNHSYTSNNIDTLTPKTTSSFPSFTREKSSINNYSPTSNLLSNSPYRISYPILQATEAIPTIEATTAPPIIQASPAIPIIQATVAAPITSNKHELLSEIRIPNHKKIAKIVIEEGENLTMQEIAKKAGVTKSTVQKCIRKYQIPYVSKRHAYHKNLNSTDQKVFNQLLKKFPRQLSPIIMASHQRVAIIVLKEGSDLTIKEIAKKAGVSKSTAGECINKYHLPYNRKAGFSKKHTNTSNTKQNSKSASP